MVSIQSITTKDLGLPETISPMLLAVGVAVLFATYSLTHLTDLVEILRYFTFLRDHDAFHRSSTKNLRGRVISYFASPWSAKTYFLQDSEAIRKMFQYSADLDYHALAEMLHKMVWKVPPTQEIALMDRAVHAAMGKGNIGPLVEGMEKEVLARFDELLDELPEKGKMMPLHHWGFRTVYDQTMRVVLGPQFPIPETRLANQILADSMQGLNAAASLPILPTSVWNRLIPAARRGSQASHVITKCISKWIDEGGPSTSSEMFKKIYSQLEHTSATPKERACWINMVQFGFSGNTGESMGWILVFLLQSPALLQQVKLEIASLPAGSIAAVDMRQACPHLDSAISETYRFVGSILSGRLVKNATKVQGIDKTFEPGSILRAMTRSATFDEEIWGPDAASFRGNRFVGNDHLLRNLQVFGGGQSACPGRHFAVQEMNVILALALRTFDFGPITFCEKNLPTDATDHIRNPARGRMEEIIDLDGKRLKVQTSGFDVNKGFEAVTGLLVPAFEPVAIMSPALE